MATRRRRRRPVRGSTDRARPLVPVDASGTRIRLAPHADPGAVLDHIRRHTRLDDFGVEAPSLSELFLDAAGDQEVASTWLQCHASWSPGGELREAFRRRSLWIVLGLLFLGSSLADDPPRRARLRDERRTTSRSKPAAASTQAFRATLTSAMDSAPTPTSGSERWRTGLGHGPWSTTAPSTSRSPPETRRS